MVNTAVLWTGGKDCCLALHEVNSQRHTVSALVTFIPAEGDFVAHPLSIIRAQAQALNLPLLEVIIQYPYRESYVRAICELKNDKSIDCLVTGDIDLVEQRPNWIRECCAGTGMEVLTPLWQQPRKSLLDRLSFFQVDARISCIRTVFLGTGWLNRKLDKHSILELEELHQQHQIDICGENGEFHTVVLDAQLFQKRIELTSISEIKDMGMSYLKINELQILEKVNQWSLFT